METNPSFNGREVHFCTIISYEICCQQAAENGKWKKKIMEILNL
jgi:hypothetical protein